MLFGEPIHPVLFGDFVTRHVLAAARLEYLQLRDSRSPLRRVPRPVSLNNFPHQIRPLQHDATARRLGRRLAEILDETALRHGLKNAGAVVNGFLGELNDRTGLDVAIVADVVTYVSL